MTSGLPDRAAEHHAGPLDLADATVVPTIDSRAVVECKRGRRDQPILEWSQVLSTS